MRRVVITGLGCITPCGIGVEETWDAVVRGRSGTKPITSFDASGCHSRVAGEIPDFRADDFLARREVQAFSRCLHFGFAAARMAWEDARATDALDRDRVGVCMGSAVGAISRNITDGLTFDERGIERVHPMCPLQYPGSLPAEVAIALGLRGPTYAISTACTAGADAAGLALGLIASGMLDAAIVGGSDAPIFPLLFHSFDRLQVVSRLNDPPERASRPFSRDRCGFVLSEGAGAVVLEAEEVARERGARVYAELAGFGASSDAHHHLHPAPDGRQGARAIEQALRYAGVGADEIDYVNAHGTGTVKNDVVETSILKQALGEHAYRLPVSSSKSMLGHMIGAAAAVELIISTLSIHAAIVPPTINVVEPDPECDLDYVTDGARALAPRVVLSPSFGFGSRNAALVVRRYETGGHRRGQPES
ncbi:MAG: beta-ketoacyl-[acyl-carrier-protein] synthase family protein [Deltaproteobacteria bacterium]|nr:beta-ketoacyl-[acyl-carrier-protein] synthase family protein [Deltaproteobacteria bacterium]